MEFERSVAATFRVAVLTRCGFVTALLSVLAWGQSDPLSAFNNALEKVVAKVAPAVVQVDATTPSLSNNDDEEDEDAPRSAQLKPQHSIGSGVILDPAGYIVTNAHVVRGASVLTVTLDKSALASSGQAASNVTEVPARVIGEFKEADLAVIKIDVEGLPTITFGARDNLKQGQLVVALGSPEGLQNSVSIGVVSSAGRQVTPEGHLLYVQTDAAINPGNSGGPLVDINGNLVGINSFFITQGGGSEGLGFAIPSRFVQFVYQSIRRNGYVPWVDSGLRVQSITPTLAAGLHLPRNSGVIVSDVAPGTPADERGVEVGDVIAKADGKPLENVPQFYETMYQKTVGDLLELTVLRNSNRVNLKVPVVAGTAPGEKNEIGQKPAINLVSKLGILCSELGARPRLETANLRSRTGVMVEAKSVGSDLQANLVAGDVIRSVNLTPVSSVAELQSLIDKAKAGTPIVFQVERKSQFLYVPVDTN